MKVIQAKQLNRSQRRARLAVLCMKRPPKSKRLRAYGDNLGIAFQLIDDALDYKADEATLAKPLATTLLRAK